MKKKYFKYKGGKLPLPVFFPDATRAVVRTLDFTDVKNTKTPGVLVNTYHLYRELGVRLFKKFGGVREFMGWDGAVISDSGGFQVMSIAKKGGGKVTDEGVVFYPTRGKKILLTPEKSIQFQMELLTDMVVVLDDFTPPGVMEKSARKSVERTLDWAKRSKDEFERICKKKGLEEGERPYILGVVQGGDYPELRRECAKELIEIGFDGFGYGGWPVLDTGKFDYETAKIIANAAPKNYLLCGLGIGKPEEIAALVQMGYGIFDCVLPTRDARHKRLYVYNADSIKEINVFSPKFYSYYTPDKEKYYYDRRPVSTACDCLLCTKYSRGYLSHLFKTKELSAMRLATIHNLRFYSILMQKLRKI